MAAETDGAFEADSGLRWRRFKGLLFRGLLVAATLFGILALVVLFALIGFDAFGLGEASPEWYLTYFVSLVVPTVAYWAYVRRHSGVADVNTKTFLVVIGCGAGALIAYTVPLALATEDVAVHTLFTLIPPAAVVAYGRVFGENRFTGPAIPVSVLIGGLAGFLFYDFVAPYFAYWSDWVLFTAFTGPPVAAVLGEIARRRWTNRSALLAAAAPLVGAGAAIQISLSLGRDPGLWIVLATVFVAPVGFLVVDTLKHRREGAVGLAGPAIIVAGTLIGATAVSRYGVGNPDTWLTSTLLLDSWSTFRPRQAGIYPQLLGSIMMVGLMGLLSFPVGIGAAIYLEEYAGATGWRGKLASALDVNISNLAGVPSVVYGLLGLALFRQLNLLPGILLAGAVTLGLLILPIVIVASQEALRSVPDEFRQASYGLGASRWQTIREVVLPEAVPGILTGTILALGRAIGETAPLVMLAIATTRFSPPEGLFSGATALPLQIFAAKGNAIPEYRTGVVAAAAIVLLALMLLMNGAAIVIRNRYQNRDNT